MAGRLDFGKNCLRLWCKGVDGAKLLIRRFPVLVSTDGRASFLGGGVRVHRKNRRLRSGCRACYLQHPFGASLAGERSQSTRRSCHLLVVLVVRLTSWHVF